MKKLKALGSRITAAVIAMCFIIQTAAVFAAQTEEDTSSAELAFGILKYTGIMAADSEYEKNYTVTRGDFALYLARLMKSPEYSAVSYSDVDGSTEKGKAIISLSESGILRGLGDGTFRPDNNITVAEMAAVAVRALGYKEYSVWTAADYVEKARSLGLLKGISNLSEASMSDCIVLLYNLLHTDMVNIVLRGLKYEEDKIGTPLELYFGLKYVKGRVTANAYSSLDGKSTGSKKSVKIDGKVYNTETETVAERLGRRVTAYYTAETETIVYFADDEKNEELVIDAEDFISFEGGSIRYFEGEKRKHISIRTDAVIIRNSQLVTTDYASAFDIEYGKITCVAYDGEYDTVIIEAYENHIIKGIDIVKHIIYTDRTAETGKSISLGDLAYYDFTMLPHGREVNESTLENEDLISVAQSADGTVLRAYLCTETVSGKTENISVEGSKVYMTINGTRYRADKYFYETYKPAAGEEGSYTLDAGGRIAAYSKSSSMNESIGYIYKLYHGDAGDDTYIKLYNTSRQHIDARLAEHMSLNGQNASAAETQKALCTLAGGKLKRQLVMYKLNSEGDVVSITLSADSKEQRIKNDSLYTVIPAGSYSWYYQMKTFDKKYPLSNNTYYMRVPPETMENPSKELFGCQTFKNVTWYNSNGSKSILGLYKFDDTTPYADLLLVQNTDGTTLTNQTEITVVSSVNEAVGADGEVVTEIRGYRRGNEVTAFIPKDLYNNDVETGDIIRFATNVKGYVGAYEVVYDYNEDDVKWAMSSTANKYTSNTSSAGGLRYTFGYINNLYLAPYSSGLNSVLQIGPTADSVEDTYQINSNNSATTRYIIVDGNRPANKVYMGDFYEAMPYDISHDLSATSRAFVHTRSGWLIAVIIYK